MGKGKEKGKKGKEMGRNRDWRKGEDRKKSMKGDGKNLQGEEEKKKG